MSDWHQERDEYQLGRHLHELEADRYAHDRQREIDLGLEPGYLADARAAHAQVVAFRAFKNEEAEQIELAKRQAFDAFWDDMRDVS